MPFIHDANTEVRKKELFSKVRSGQVRVLIGSTAKMGAGTNCQDKLIALHDADCPWRPSDLAQRLGRIVRQGNQNPEVEIFRYVTENTFDAYLYQLVENKQKFIAQIMTSKAPARIADDVDETALSYSEIKALATGNPLIIEKCNLDVEVSKLNMLKITNDGRKLALDMRLVNPLAPNSDTSKTSICAQNVFSIWERTQGQRSAQLVFSDLSTPKGDGSFNIYDDLKAKLVAKGIPPEEIAFHS